MSDPTTMHSREHLENVIKGGGSVLLPGGKLVTTLGELPNELEMAAGNDASRKQLIQKLRGEIAQREEQIKQLEEGPRKAQPQLTQEELADFRAWRQQYQALQGQPAGDAEGEEHEGGRRPRKAGPRQRKAEEGAAGEGEGQPAE